MLGLLRFKSKLRKKQWTQNWDLRGEKFKQIDFQRLNDINKKIVI